MHKNMVNSDDKRENETTIFIQVIAKLIGFVI